MAALIGLVTPWAFIVSVACIVLMGYETRKNFDLKVVEINAELERNKFEWEHPMSEVKDVD